MVRTNNWSGNLDAYRILQEAQILTKEPPHFDAAFPVEPESIASSEHHNHRYFIAQEEHRVRHLAENRNTGCALSTCVRERQR
ncbi:hypothetical protein ALP01_200397 [Pseudomonas caricapapayae]|nr:hypothetical protein ALP01_200397 [Pseudomonas caricapapayae]